MDSKDENIKERFKNLMLIIASVGITVLVSLTTKKYDYEKNLKEMSNNNQYMPDSKENGEIIVITSKSTGKDRVFQSMLKQDAFYDWKDYKKIKVYMPTILLNEEDERYALGDERYGEISTSFYFPVENKDNYNFFDKKVVSNEENDFNSFIEIQPMNLLYPKTIILSMNGNENNRNDTNYTTKIIMSFTDETALAEEKFLENHRLENKHFEKSYFKSSFTGDLVFTGVKKLDQPIKYYDFTDQYSFQNIDDYEKEYTHYKYNLISNHLEKDEFLELVKSIEEFN